MEVSLRHLTREERAMIVAMPRPMLEAFCATVKAHIALGMDKQTALDATVVLFSIEQRCKARHTEATM